MKKYAVFIRLNIEAESADRAVEIAESIMDTIPENTPDGYEGWEYMEYDPEEIP